MSPARQALIWGAGLVLFGLALHVLAPILLPFVAGVALAYFFDPVVTWLARLRVNRTVGTLLVLSLFAAAIVLIIWFVWPLLERQLLDFAAQAPDLLRRLQERGAALAARLSDQLSAADLAQLRSAAGSFAGDAVKFLAQLLGRLWSGGVALLNLLSLIFISPIVAFFVLRDWPLIVAKVDSWLPRDHAPTVRRLAGEADRVISGYVRGAALVCIILGTFYAVGLSLVGLNFGLVIGLVAGLISFIPFVGAAVGFVLSVGVAIVQFEAFAPIAVTAGIFAAGQALEGNFLTPKLVGDRIGLHPVWVIFALLVGGLLFGFVGVLLAVPVAAVAGVLVRFAMGKYLASRLYRGNTGGGAVP